MYNTMSVIWILPLRAGSKRISGKNIKLLNWKPLFTYTVDAALKAKHIDSLLITTDDPAVKEITQELYSTKVQQWTIQILDRDPALASDTATTIDVVIDVINTKNLYDDVIVVMQATTPLRTAVQLDEALELFYNTSAWAVVSMKRVEEFAHRQYSVDESLEISPLCKELNNVQARSQDVSTAVIGNWWIYITTWRTCVNTKTLYPPRTYAYIMDSKSSLDIDTVDDFMYCQYIMLHTQ